MKVVNLIIRITLMIAVASFFGCMIYGANNDYPAWCSNVVDILFGVIVILCVVLCFMPEPDPKPDKDIYDISDMD